MAEIIMTSPGLPARKREAQTPLSPLVSNLVWLTTALSLLALSTLLPITLATALLLVFVVFSIIARKKTISPLVRLCLFSGMVLLVVIQGMGFRSESGTALLIASMIVKQLHTRTSRDASTMLLFNIIAPFTAMLQNQNPTVLVISLLALFVGLSSSLAQSESRTRGVSSALRRTFFLLLAVAPLAVLMYLLIPRLDAPMWVSGRSSSITGVSERMDVSAWQNVMNDYSTAFRVYFEEPPPMGLQYYRGYVLWSFNGSQWERTPLDPQAESSSPPLGDPNQIWANYQISYEDQSTQRLFLLDYPAQAIEGVRFSSSGETLWASASRRRVVATAAHPISFDLTPSQRQSALALPENSSPRLQSLVEDLRSRYVSDVDFAAAALRHFSSGYTYSLTPSRLDRSQPVDSFVFDTKEGFCIHYSSAFAVMLRMAGIPSRVITGYASTEVSDLGNYHRVRQADAHAWVEAWIDGAWVRYDPTTQSTSDRTGSSGWTDGWRNSGYEMSDWFKSYWDQWIEYYDAGAQEKALGDVQQSFSSLTDKVIARPWLVLSGILSVILTALLLPRIIVFIRTPTPFIMLNRMTLWLDAHAPVEFPGQQLHSRLAAVEWISSVSKEDGERKIRQLEKWVYDPTAPPPTRPTRIRFNREVSQLLISWGRMKKTFHKSQPSRKND